MARTIQNLLQSIFQKKADFGEWRKVDGKWIHYKYPYLNGVLLTPKEIYDLEVRFNN